MIDTYIYIRIYSVYIYIGILELLHLAMCKYTYSIHGLSENRLEQEYIAFSYSDMATRFWMMFQIRSLSKPAVKPICCCVADDSSP